MAYSPVAAGADFRHVCFFYRTEADYATTVAGFLRAALDEGEAAFAAVPPAKAWRSGMRSARRRGTLNSLT